MGLAAAMAFAPCMPVFAEERLAVAEAAAALDAKAKDSLTVKGAVEGHTYKMYQIFTGSVGETEEGKTASLGNAKYGSNYVPEGKKAGDTVPADELKGGGYGCQGV